MLTFDGGKIVFETLTLHGDKKKKTVFEINVELQTNCSSHSELLDKTFLKNKGAAVE